VLRSNVRLRKGAVRENELAAAPRENLADTRADAERPLEDLPELLERGTPARVGTEVDKDGPHL
jgi:hypothetical protein